MWRNFALFISFFVVTFSSFSVENMNCFDNKNKATIRPLKKRINAPVISNISNCEGIVTISGTLNVPSPTKTTVKIYLINAKRISLSEEFFYLKSTPVDAKGNWETILIGLSGGEKIKVSSEDLALNTSDFSSEYRVPFPFFVESAQTNIKCYESVDGSIDVIASGGVPPYNYHWAHGPTKKKLTELKGGDYAVTVTDSAGCSSDLVISISEPAGPLVLNFAVTNASCAICSNGSVDATVTGGTPNYTYEWSNGFTTEDLQVLDSGIYCLTVTDANGCTETSCATISELYFVYDYGTIQYWNIYPNPAKQSINIQLFDRELLGEVFVIRDFLGREYYTIRLESMLTNLDITLLETGAYIASILSDGRLLSSRLVVDK